MISHSLSRTQGPLSIQVDEAATQEFRESFNSAVSYALASKSDSTHRSYSGCFRTFRAWCNHVSANPLPATPATVAAYIAFMAGRGYRPSTINIHASAIAFAHRASGFPSPTTEESVRAVFAGIRRRLGMKPIRKAPATAKIIARMVRRIPDTLKGKRDRALLLIGFAAALRRSELVALDADHIEIASGGIYLHIPKSKTDQEQEGQVIAIPLGSKLRPVEALQDWLNASGIRSGPLFRGLSKSGRLVPYRLCDRQVARLVKEYAEAANLDPSTFSGLSLRAGFVTSALKNGADLLQVRAVTRHKNVDSLKIYDRRPHGFINHAGRGFL